MNRRDGRVRGMAALLGMGVLCASGCGGSPAKWSDIPRDPFWPQVPSEYSIGVFTAAQPFDVPGGMEQIQAPALGPSDIEDFATAYVADPFLLEFGGRWYLFYELLPAWPRRGCIGWAESEDGVQWAHRGIALAEPFHLSYPYVFAWEGRALMVTESHEKGEVRLYEAYDFPRDWRLVSVLVEGAFVDPSLVRHGDRWWLFASTLANRDLHLFHSGELERGWQPHPQSPVVRGDPHRARPAGRVLSTPERLWRVAQDCVPRYGSATRLMEIEKLTPTEYVEREAENSPLLQAGLVPWADLGMHHYDAQPYQAGDSAWLVAVDGNRRAQPETVLDIQFDDGSLLLGTTQRPRRVRPGEILMLRLYWKNLPEDDDFSVFVHFKQKGEMIFQGDHDRRGRGEQYDLYVPVPASAAPGPLEIWCGLYRSDDRGFGRKGRSALRSSLPQERGSIRLPVDCSVAVPAP